MTRAPFLTLLRRALSLRCVVCGEGRPFRGPFRMRERCEVCSYRYARESGYFVGSAYMSSIFGILAVAVAYGLLGLAPGLAFERKLPILFAIAVLFPLWFFRYARGLWIVLDLLMGRPSGPSRDAS